jgi:hypothetical protein
MIKAHLCLRKYLFDLLKYSKYRIERHRIERQWTFLERHFFKKNIFFFFFKKKIFFLYQKIIYFKKN